MSIHLLEWKFMRRFKSSQAKWSQAKRNDKLIQIDIEDSFKSFKWRHLTQHHDVISMLFSYGYVLECSDAKLLVVGLLRVVDATGYCQPLNWKPRKCYPNIIIALNNWQNSFGNCMLKIVFIAMLRTRQWLSLS